MSAPQGVESSLVPIPYKGMNLRDPSFNLSPVYSPLLLNCEPEPQHIRVRNAWHIHAITTGVGTPSIAGLIPHGNSTLKAYVNDSGGDSIIYDVTTATPSTDFDSNSTQPDEAYWFRYANRTWYLTETDWAAASAYYNGSTWTAWDFEVSSVSVGGRVAAAHKGRLYFFNDTTMYYTDSVGQVSGEVNEVDVTGLFGEDAPVFWAATLSSPGNDTEEQLFVYGNQLGETLVYAGDYPDAANWEQVARFKHAQVVAYNAVLSFDNDVWIVTKSGMVSIREMMTFKAVQKNHHSSVSRIDPYIARHVKTTTFGVTNSSISLAHWPEQNKIYILLSGHVDDYSDSQGTYNDEATLLVYNMISEAWCVQRLEFGFSGQCGGLAYFNDGLYMFVDNVVMKLNPDSYKDEAFDDEDTFSEYQVEIHGVYSNYNNTRKQKTIAGFDALVKTDFGDNHIGMKAASDLGRKVSTAISYHKFPTDGYNNPYYPINIQGEYIQWRFSGTSDEDSSDGFELYSIAVGLL